jgi:PPM family protein phosphatase
MTLPLEQAGPRKPLALDFSAMSHTGTARASNQDAWAVVAEAGLLLVADGVGGQGDGTWASARAVTLVSSYLRRALRFVEPGSTASRERIVRAAMAFCSAQMHRKAVLVGGKASGTTLVGFWAPPGHGGNASVFNVGDSSLFRIMDGVATKISRDHSLHQLWVDGGMIGAEPSKRVITQALGISPEIQPHVMSFKIAPGEAYLACTDGLTGVLSRPRIVEIVRMSATASDGTRALLEDALRRLARDNVTAAVCKVADC